MSENDDARPSTTSEKETFSSGGRRHLIVLRGSWGLAVDRAVFLLTGYSPMTKQYCFAQGHPYQKTLMLSTIGARTGKIRRANLPFFEVDGDLVVRGSNGGGPTDPHWAHNVRAHAPAWIRIGFKTSPIHAHVATGDERERLYEKMCRMSSTTKSYQDMCAPRELPLVVLRAWSRVTR